MDLSARSLEVAGVDWSAPVEVAAICACWPVESFGRTSKYKRSYVIRTVAMLHAGVVPDLLDDGEGGVWNADDLWLHALHGLVAFIDVAAGRLGVERPDLCTSLRGRPLSLDD